MGIITISCKIFIRSVLAYAVLTLPAVYLDVIYLFSLVFAVVFGLVALLIFISILYMLRYYAVKAEIVYKILYLLIMLSVLCALETIQWCGLVLDVWEQGPLLLFPLTAVIAGWIGVYQHKTEVENYFSFTEDQIL